MMATCQQEYSWLMSSEAKRSKRLWFGACDGSLLLDSVDKGLRIGIDRHLQSLSESCEKGGVHAEEN